MSQSQHILPPNHAVLTILVYKVIISVQREILSIDLVGFYFELDLERDAAVVFITCAPVFSMQIAYILGSRTSTIQ